MTCRHHPERFRALRVYANRLILARLDDNDYTSDMIAAEIADCPSCWRDIAVYLAALASEHLVEACGDDEAAALSVTEDRIASALD